MLERIKSGLSLIFVIAVFGAIFYGLWLAEQNRLPESQIVKKERKNGKTYYHVVIENHTYVIKQDGKN